MSDTIGRITVPTVIDSAQTFPLTTQYPFGFSVERPVNRYACAGLRRMFQRLRQLSEPAQCIRELHFGADCGTPVLGGAGYQQ
jgi:hypothetical protein